MINTFFTGDKDPGKISFQPLLPWWLGFQVFIQGTQDQFLGRKLRFDFMPPLHFKFHVPLMPEDTESKITSYKGETVRLKNVIT